MFTRRWLRTACSVGFALAAVAARGESTDERAVAIRITHFQVNQPDRVREIRAAVEADSKDDSEARSRAFEAWWNADPDRTDPLTPAEQAALEDAIGFERVGGKLVSKSDRVYRRQMWNATRGLSPVIEVECVLRVGQQASARVWNAALERAFVDSYRLTKLDGDEAFYQQSSEFEVGDPLQVVSAQTLRFGEPQVGEVGIGGPSCEIGFLEVRAAPAGRDSGTCSVHYAPEAAPPSDAEQHTKAERAPVPLPASAGPSLAPD